MVHSAYADIFRSDEKLNTVSAAAANDVWAVGSKQMPGSRTLTR